MKVIGKKFILFLVFGVVSLTSYALHVNSLFFISFLIALYNAMSAFVIALREWVVSITKED